MSKLEPKNSGSLRHITDVPFHSLTLLAVSLLISVISLTQCIHAPDPGVLDTYDVISTSGSYPAAGFADYYICSDIDFEYSGAGIHDFWLESNASYTHSGTGLGNIYALNNNVVELINGSGFYTVYAAAGSTVIISTGDNLIYAECGATIINNSSATNILYECADDITNNATGVQLFNCPDVALNFPNAPGNILNIGGVQTIDCDDFPITLDASSLPGPYNWNTGESTATIQVNSVGTYTCAVPSTCATAIGTAIVQLNEPIEQIGLGFTVDFCFEELPFILDAGPDFDSYLWSTGETTQTIEVNEFETYNVEAFRSCQNGAGEIILIGFTEPEPFVTAETFDGCNYDFPITLSTGNYNYYNWSTGENTSSIEVNSIDIYDVTVGNFCGSRTYTYDLAAAISPPVPVLPDDTDYCSSDFPINLSTNAIFDSYSWTTLEGTPSIEITSAGTYGVEVTTDCGTGYSEVVIGEVGGPPLLDLGDDLTFCDDDFPLEFSSPQTYSTYLWSNGDQTQSTTIDTPQLVTLEVSNQCGVATDEFLISTLGDVPLLNLGPDVSYCSAEFPITISAQGGDSFLWSNSEITQSIEINEPLTISVESTNQCGSISDEIIIGSLGDVPSLDLGADRSYCDFEFPIFIDAGSEFTSYLWHNTEQTQVIEISGPELITLEVSNICGTVSDELEITSSGDYPVVNLGPDLDYCLADFPVTLDAGTFDSYDWSDLSSDQTVEIDSPQTISVNVTSSCGTASDEIIIGSLGDVPSLDLGADRSYCDYEFPIFIDAGSEFTSYLWHNTEQTQVIEISGPELITLEVANICGTVSDELEVFSLGLAPDLDLGPDMNYCIGDYPIYLEPEMFESYNWSNTDDVTSFTWVDTPQTILLEVSNFCGSSSDEITLGSLGDIAEIELGEDVSLCNADFPLSLDAGEGGNEYYWSTGEETQTITIYEAQTVSVEVINQCGLSSDHIFITSAGDVPSLDLGPDLAYCLNQFPITLNADENDTYIWSNGSTENSILITEPQEISLEVMNQCGTDTDEIIISSLGNIPSIDLGEDMSYCPSLLPITIGLNQDYDSILWSTGENTEAITINETQIIYVEASNICGSASDEINIEILEDENQELNLILCEDGEVVFENDIITEPGIYSYSQEDLASNGCALNTEVSVVFIPQELELVVIDLEEDETYEYNGVIYDQEGSYYFSENSISGCSIDIELILNYLDKNIDVFIPNAFTPDYDGLNDVFQPSFYIGNDVKVLNYSFEIFNRDGKLIYSSLDINETAWKGEDKSSSNYFVKDDVYNWKLTLQTSKSTSPLEYSGSVTILR